MIADGSAMAEDLPSLERSRAGGPMKAHRIRIAKSLYDQARDHIFLEMERNRWLEIETLDGLNYDSIQAFMRCERETGLRVVGFTDQNFQWGTIKDWHDSGIIRDLKGSE